MLVGDFPALTNLYFLFSWRNTTGFLSNIWKVSDEQKVHMFQIAV